MVGERRGRRARRRAASLGRAGRRGVELGVGEPAADLALALAVASGAVDRPLREGLVVLGEVGLAGEVRRVTGVGRRAAEAARLGFPLALVPAGSGALPAGSRALEVSTLDEALAAGLRP